MSMRSHAKIPPLYIKVVDRNKPSYPHFVHICGLLWWLVTYPNVIAVLRVVNFCPCPTTPNKIWAVTNMWHFLARAEWMIVMAMRNNSPLTWLVKANFSPPIAYKRAKWDDHALRQ